MLHLIHMIERRLGNRPGAARTARILLAAVLVLALGLGLLLSLQARAQDAANPSGKAIATRLLDHLDAGQYAQAEALFSAEMSKAVPAAKLEALWASLPAQVGKPTGRGEPQQVAQGGITQVQVPLHYENAGLLAKVVIDGDGRIVGFMVQPAQAVVPAAAVPDSANFSEREVQVGSGERALPGTLAMPKGSGPFPGVVLVHGSGAHDRDETIGPNKPFLDIARGLAAQGIAVLRYEKRSKARPQDLANSRFTVDDETTNDAVLAVSALRGIEGIDGKRVFVLGHSQGGMMAPRIAAVSGHVAGLVLLAAPARSLLDIVVEQNRRLAVLDDGKTSDAERDAINQLVEQVRTIRDARTDVAAKTLLAQPAGYWRSIDAVDPITEANSVALPMLVLQGARDIQVVDADWQLWRGAFHKDPKVAFKLYEKLNHLGIAGEGEGTLAEYNIPGHVDAQLIADVAGWVQAH
ncbi:MAG: alpha/beta fold hydrolase [Pseudomonadota bacterium]